MSVANKCKVENCIYSNNITRGYCNRHYLRLLRYGSPTAGSNLHKKHGMVNSIEYSSWSGMISRCKNKNSTSYEKYGGSGIQVCERWLKSFSNFYEDMGERPGLQYSIDRIDGSKGYYKENCRWADYHTQSVNTKIQSRNKTGFKGVFLRPDTGKYSVKITHYGKIIYIGTSYDTLEEAISARLMAESIYWY